MLGDGEEESLKQSRVERCDAHFCDFFLGEGGRCFGRIVNVSSFFLISRVEVFLILQFKILDLILISFL